MAIQVCLSLVLLSLVTQRSTAQYDSLRPQFHFAATTGVIADTEAPFYDYMSGVYHLMILHNPDATTVTMP
jgi:sucrose-6-phosphate hydrolase SacC (GH32 family)